MKRLFPRVQVGIGCSRGRCLLQRISPTEAVEPGKIGVVAVDFGLVFDRECGELGVSREISGCAELFKITEEEVGEFRPGL